jgi:hypothetical protein
VGVAYNNPCSCADLNTSANKKRMNNILSSRVFPSFNQHEISSIEPCLAKTSIELTKNKIKN